MFKIGEFSKIAQVSGHLLRYYDEIGLLRPAKIDEWTGYRYYSAKQLPRLNRILALKELGLSLDQVQRMMNEAISADEIRGMFALKKAQLEQTIREEVVRLQLIEARLEQIDEGDELDNFEVVLKSIPEQMLLGLRDNFATFDEARQAFGQIQRALPKSVPRKSVGHLVTILHTELYGAEVLDLEMGLLLTDTVVDAVPLGDGRSMGMRTLPAVEMMATTVRIGSPQMAYPCRGALATWVENNGYEFAGEGREVFLVPPRAGREDETVFEIQYPVAPVSGRQLLLN